MKLTNFAVSGIAKPTIQTGKPTEDKKGREARMRAFWKSDENKVLYKVGNLLAVKHEGKSLAQHLTEGKAFEMDVLNMPNGAKLPLQAGFSLSMASIKVWGCVACRSAHGSGIAPSRDVDYEVLENNPFYYNPATKALFTISATCWKYYVADLKAGTAERFIEVPSPVSAKA